VLAELRLVRNKVQIAGTLTMMDIGAMARSDTKKRGSRDVMSIVPIIRYRPTIVNLRIVTLAVISQMLFSRLIFT
jgi:hypothetical protein